MSVAPAHAAGAPPAGLDCDALPCDAVAPGAAACRPVVDASHWEALDADGDVVGWIALSMDFVDLDAYSGKPMVTLVGLDPDGVITGARVVHREPDGVLVVETERDAVTWLQGATPEAIVSAEIGVDRLEDLYKLLLHDVDAGARDDDGGADRGALWALRLRDVVEE